MRDSFFAVNIPLKKKAVYIFIRAVSGICALIVFSGSISSCGKQKYVAKPLDPAIVNTKIAAKNPANTAFRAYLIKQGYAENALPFQTWGINELTSAALYFNPKLDVAKAQLAVADTGVDTASQRQNPAINGNLAYSNRANGDINPWSYGLSLDIPLQTANKRAIKIEEARYLRDAAELDIAEIAWQLRSQIAKDLIAYHENIALQANLARELSTHADIIEMLKKRLALGMIDSSTFNNAKLLQQRAQITANALQKQEIEIRAALAADTGLNLDKLDKMQIRPLDVDSALAQRIKLLEQQDANGQSTFKLIQENALLNRLDVRRSLARYAAAEAKIKLEVARQTPDIVLSPGYIFEFGDKIWSLGFASLLNLLNRNQTLIAEATQLREVQGAQFEVLQTKIISDLSLAFAQLTTALQNIRQNQAQLENQQNQQRQLQKQLDAGLTDRLAVTQQSLQYLLAQQQLLLLKFNGLKAMTAIEDLMQRPIYDLPKSAEFNQQMPTL